MGVRAPDEGAAHHQPSPFLAPLGRGRGTAAGHPAAVTLRRGRGFSGPGCGPGRNQRSGQPAILQPGRLCTARGPAGHSNRLAGPPGRHAAQSRSGQCGSAGESGAGPGPSGRCPPSREAQTALAGVRPLQASAPKPCRSQCGEFYCREAARWGPCPGWGDANTDPESRGCGVTLGPWPAPRQSEHDDRASGVQAKGTCWFSLSLWLLDQRRPCYFS